MKQALIVALVCVNVALLAALMLVVSAPPAQAQGFGGIDYIMVPGRVQTNTSAVYILDVPKQQLTAIYVDKTAKAITAIGSRLIRTDFRESR